MIEFALFKPTANRQTLISENTADLKKSLFYQLVFYFFIHPFYHSRRYSFCFVFSGPEVIKLFSYSAEHEIYPSHKC